MEIKYVLTASKTPPQKNRFGREYQYKHGRQTPLGYYRDGGRAGRDVVRGERRGHAVPTPLGAGNRSQNSQFRHIDENIVE